MIEITGPLKLIRAQGKAAYPYCHCLYVDDEVKAVLDTGAGRRAFAKVAADQVDMVLYTHFHPDHIHCHELFDQAQYHIHALDYPPMVSWEQYLYYTGIHLWEALIGSPQMDYGEMMRQRHTDDDFPDVGFRKRQIDHILQDGDVIDFGSTSATVIHTPGHTPGHCSYYFEKEGLVFTGDIDLIPSGPWYGSYLSNVEDFIKSIRKIKELQPRTVVSCHRRLITENIQKELDAYLGKLLEQEEKTLNALQSPATLTELANKGIIYRQHPHMFYLFWEKMMVLHHLERLEIHGQVSHEGERWFRNH